MGGGVWVHVARQKMGQLYQLKLDPEEGSKDPDVQEESGVPEGPKVQDITHSKSYGKFLNVLKYPKAEWGDEYLESQVAYLK